MRCRLLLAASLAASMLAGCYRTHYVNLEPGAADAPDAPATKSMRSGWQHFFLYGWVPTERVYEADDACGPNGQVREIRTQQTFLQGLVQQLASYYINIYSPYDLEIFCVSPTPTASQ